MTFLSTRKYDTGTFQRLLDEAEDKGIKLYAWCIWEVLEKCTRKCKDDRVHGNCQIYDKCKGLAHHCDGYYKIDDWIGKARTLSTDTLDTQWLNLRPSKEALVYGKYDRNIHRKPRDFRPDTSYVIAMSAIDFGSSPGHPFVYQKCWVDYSDLMNSIEDYDDERGSLVFKLKFYIFYEYRSGENTMEYHSTKIKESPYYETNEIIFADPSAKQSRIDLLNLYGIDTYSAVNDVEPGIDLVRTHLETYYDYTEGGTLQSYLYVVDGYLDSEGDLIGTDKEFEMYKYPKLQDGKISRKQPIKLYDHGMDCIRYIVQSAYEIIVSIAVPPTEVVEQDGFWFQNM